MHPFQWGTVSTHIFRSKEQFLVRYAFFDLDETDFYNVSWPVSYAVLVRYDCDAYETQTLCLPFAAQSINLGDDTLIVLFFCFALFVCLLFSSFLSTTKPLNVLGYANSCKLHQKLMKGLIVELTALCNVSMPTRNVRRRWNFKVIPLVRISCPILSSSLISSSGPICPPAWKEGHRHRRTSCLRCFHGSILSVANSINTTEEPCIIRSPMRGGPAEQ